MDDTVTVTVPAELVRSWREMRDEFSRLDDFTEAPGEYGDVNDVGEYMDEAAGRLAHYVAEQAGI